MKLRRRDLFRYGIAGGFSLWLLRPNFAQAATTFNVHYGLSAWPQNTALARGARRSNGGNAYQVITAGTTANTPGAGPTGTGSNITDGTVHWKYLSAIDYVSLQDWANNQPGTQAVNYVVQLWNNGLITTDPTTQFLSYISTAGSFSTLITCAPGEGLIGNRSSPLVLNQANGVTFQAPSSGAQTFPYFFIATDNVTISGIQYQDPQSDHNLGFDMDGLNCRLDQCILDAWQPIYAPVNNFGLTNSLVICRAASSDQTWWPAKWETGTTGAYVVGCTFIASGVQAVVVHLSASAGSGIVRDSAFFGSGTPVMSQDAAGAWAIDHCGFDVASADLFTSPAFGFANTDSGNNLVSLVASSQFVNSASNFRLKAGSSLINAGTTDTAHISAANDIYGVHRPQATAWDIGAQEFSSGAGGLLLSGVG